MKKIYQLMFIISILLCNHASLLAQITVKFTKSEITTKEIDEETIELPIVFSGDWPVGIDKFDVILQLVGSASDQYDYTIDTKQYTIQKSDIGASGKKIKIKIKRDDLFDDKEELIITLAVDQLDATKVKVDPLNNSLKISIRDSNELLDEVLRRINSDPDTSESVGTIRLHSLKPTLYTIRKKVDKSKSDSTKKLLSPENGRPKGGYGKEITSLEDDIALDSSLQTVDRRISRPDSFYEHILSYLQVRVQKAELSIFNGVVSDIKVYADIYKWDTTKKEYLKEVSEIFSNLVSRKNAIIDVSKGTTTIHKKRVPISIRHLIYDSRIAETKLYSVGMAQGRYKNDYIKFGDVIWYDPNLARNYPPGDNESIILTPEPENREKKLTTRTSLRSYINLNIYSDFLALTKAEKGNGLVQTEASAHIFLNTKNNVNKYSYFLNYLEPYMKFSRFDTGYNTVNADTLDNGQININRSLLNQRSFLNLGIKLNLFRWITKFNNDFEINTFSQFDWANARGKALTRANASDALEYESLRVNMLSLGAEIKYRTILYRNFGLTSGWKTSFQELWNRPEYENKKWSWYHSPEFELFYFPIAKSDDKIFIRFKTLITTFHNERNFVQLQVGYKGQFNFKTK